MAKKRTLFRVSKCKSYKKSWCIWRARVCTTSPRVPIKQHVFFCWKLFSKDSLYRRKCKNKLFEEAEVVPIRENHNWLTSNSPFLNGIAYEWLSTNMISDSSGHQRYGKSFLERNSKHSKACYFLYAFSNKWQLTLLLTFLCMFEFSSIISKSFSDNDHHHYYLMPAAYAKHGILNQQCGLSKSLAFIWSACWFVYIVGV